MSKRNVSYTKDLKAKAISEGKGVFTIDLHHLSDDGKRLGNRITIQGPATNDELRKLLKHSLEFIKVALKRPKKEAESASR